jgi:RNA-binding protein
MTLSAQHIRYLRGLTHQLQPVVTVADKGLSENVLAELEAAFTKHELIKVKLRGDRESRAVWIREIGNQFKAERVHVIGQVACFYRRNSKKPVIGLPGKDPQS